MFVDMESKLLFKLSVILGLMLFLFSSCEIRKRVYRPGFYISSVSNKEPEGTPLVENTVKRGGKAKEVRVSCNERERSEATFMFFRYCPGDSCNDMIYFKSEASTRVKIISDTGNTVHYIMCDRNDGKVYIAKKEEIKTIAYADASKNAPPNPIHKKFSIFGILNIVFYIAGIAMAFLNLLVLLGLFTLLVAGSTLFGFIQLSRDHDSFKARWMVYGGIPMTLTLLGGLFVLIIIAVGAATFGI